MQKDILDFLSEFAVFLQDHKFAVSESALAHLLRSVESAGVDITEEDECWPHFLSAWQRQASR